MNDLERIRDIFHTPAFSIWLDESDIEKIAQAIIDAGYVKREEIKIDEEKLFNFLDDIFTEKLDMWVGNKTIEPITKAISQNIQSLIIKKEEV